MMPEGGWAASVARDQALELLDLAYLRRWRAEVQQRIADSGLSKIDRLGLLVAREGIDVFIRKGEQRLAVRDLWRDINRATEEGRRLRGAAGDTEE